MRNALVTPETQRRWKASYPEIHKKCRETATGFIHEFDLRSALAPGSGPQPDVESVISLVRGMTTVARFLWPIPDRGISRRLHRVRAPTLVVHGQEDRFVPAAYVNDWLALLPDARGEVIPGAGHMLTVEALDRTLAAVDAFLGQVEAFA